MNGLRKQRTQFGFSLIEVVVSMLVTSVSVLGMTGMQVTSKRAGYEAVQRSTATNMAMDILERIRSNPGVLANYTVEAIGGGTIDEEPIPRCSNDTTELCTPEQLVLRDLWEWEQAIDGASETRLVSDETIATGGILNPTGCITVTGNIVTVTMAWEGYEALTNPGGISCGAGLGKYGTADENRQVISVSTFIADE